jgi:hypothetical protein
MVKHREEARNADLASDWSRMASYLNGFDYIRPKEQSTATFAHFGFAWGGDVEDVFKIWNSHRNGLARGAEVRLDAQPWSISSSRGHVFQELSFDSSSPKWSMAG